MTSDPFNTGLFDETNLTHLSGEQHKSLRQQLTPLFTMQKLDVYFESYKDRLLRYFNKWDGRSSEFRSNLHQLNLENSLVVFLGSNATSEESQIITTEFPLFNEALFSLPINIPGTRLHRGFQAMHTIRNTLEKIVIRCIDKYKRSPEEPRICVLDWWAEHLDPNLSPSEMAHHLFDSMYASQDAKISALSWAMTLLDLHPEVKEKLRTELIEYTSQMKITEFKLNMVDLHQLKYLDRVVKEILRYRPPATLLPHITLQDYNLGGHPIKKGTYVFPSIYDSCHQGCENPDIFDPERINADKSYSIPFGLGPHRCLGNLLAVHNLKLFISYLIYYADWKRDSAHGPVNDVIQYLPTTFPLNTHFYFKVRKD